MRGWALHAGQNPLAQRLMANTRPREPKPVPRRSLLGHSPSMDGGLSSIGAEIVSKSAATAVSQRRERAMNRWSVARPHLSDAHSGNPDIAEGVGARCVSVHPNQDNLHRQASARNALRLAITM